MSRMFITSNKGPSKLKLGYPVMSDKYDAVPFVLVVDADSQEILPGTALMVTDTQGTYKAVRDYKTELTKETIHKVVGFALGTNVKVPNTFPADGPDYIQPGESGVCVTSGTIAVEYLGNDPKEADKVLVVTVAGTGYPVGTIVSDTTTLPTNAKAVQLVGWRFMGINDTDEGRKVAAIYKGF